MIITKNKPIEDILTFIKGKKKVFLIGCKLCATTCGTGGEVELKKIKKTLEENGKVVTGSVVMDPACSLIEVRKMNRAHSKEISDAEAILSFACGGGTQAAAEGLESKEVYPGNDTLFQGEITEMSLKGAKFQQKCSLCGECMLAVTGGICPVTLCPKGLVNGPCGGIKKGKCEIDETLDCAWLLIYDRLKKSGRLGEMKRIFPPKDHTKSKKPQRASKG